jgi:hypothetical protein
MERFDPSLTVEIKCYLQMIERLVEYKVPAACLNIDMVIELLEKIKKELKAIKN